MINSASNISRIAVLFSRLSGYTSACLKALKSNFGIELLVYRWPVSSAAPFDEGSFSWIDRHRVKDGQSAREIVDDVLEFDPDAVFLGAGWMDAEYLSAARALKRKGIPIIGASDNQWTGRWRQQIGRLTSRWYLHSAMDVLWVPGDRQRFHARKLGFSGEKCWMGLYACDWDAFVESARKRSHSSPGETFLFVGRYDDVKGLDVLLEAYRAYRKTVERPWNLACVGAGPQKSRLANEEGVVDLGFIQPDDLGDRMQLAGAFVLPSRKEPWGVVIQEAAATGLPLICSDACGAAAHLLTDGYNGYLFESENVNELAWALQRMSSASSERRTEMGERSLSLSRQFTPDRWAATLVEGLAELSRT